MDRVPKKRGAWTVCQFKRELGKKEGRLIPQCTLFTKLLQSFTIFQSTRNNGVKIWVFDATRGISTDIDFTDEEIVQCYVPVIKILL